MATLASPPAVELERLLSERIAAALSSPPAPCKVEGPFARSVQTAIYRAVCPNLPHPVFIKRSRGNPRLEFEALRSARERLSSHSDAVVPLAYPYLLDDGFVIMEWLEAPTVGQLLRHPTAGPSSLVSALELAGKWLRAFHGEGEGKLGFLRIEQMLRNLHTARVPQLSRDPRPFPSYIKLLEETGLALERLPMPICLSHGDFKPDNVIIDRNRVIGFDFNRIFKAPIMHDITHFLLHLDLDLLHPAGWRLLPWRGHLRAAFLRGYRSDISASQRVVMSWLLLQGMLRQYYEQIGELAALRRWASIAYLRVCYSRCARLYVRDLRRALCRSGGTGVA